MNVAIHVFESLDVVSNMIAPQLLMPVNITKIHTHPRDLNIDPLDNLVP